MMAETVFARNGPAATASVPAILVPGETPMQTVTRAMSAGAVLAALALPAPAQFTPAPLSNPNAFGTGTAGAAGPLANLVNRAGGGANFFNPANLAGLGGTMSSSPIAGAGTAGLNTANPSGSNFP